MTKKIISKILIFVISIIAVTALLIVSVFYSYYEKQELNKLEEVTSLIEFEIEKSGSYDFINNQLHSVTNVMLISSDGKVIADNSGSFSVAQSGLDDNDIEKLRTDGENAVKKETDKGSFYYCVKQIDGGSTLLTRVPALSIFNVTKNVALYILIVLLIAVICSVFVSAAITSNIMKPIEELGKNLDDPDKVKSYKELKPFVNALKEQKKKQKALDRQKKQFTANVSHELKTPLTSIAGYAELIETGIAKEPDIKPFAATIRKQALRLVTLSEDIIQLSQLEEKDETGIAFADTDIYEIAERCVNALSINAQTKGVSMSLHGESTVIKANSALIEELIYNLCDNAIRYNKPNGKVTVEIKNQPDGVLLSVADTGIGIAEKYHDRIFERFFRVDKSRSKATGGTGLGLAIVKHISQIHNAKLKVDSELGKGTVISVLFKK